MDFGTMAIKGRDSMGNILTRYAIHKIVLKEKGFSTLGGRKIWYDEDVNRINADGRGRYLGEFSGDNKIFVITKSGFYQLYSYDLENHFDEDVLVIEKFSPKKIYSAVYFDAEQSLYYLKRFDIEPIEKPSNFIGEHPGSQLICLSDDSHPRIEIKFGGKHSKRENEVIDVAEFIGVKGHKAKGRRLSTFEIDKVIQLEPLISEIPEESEQELFDLSTEESVETEGHFDQTDDEGDNISGDIQTELEL
jgi:topoisomerase-4 subunit A